MKKVFYIIKKLLINTGLVLIALYLLKILLLPAIIITLFISFFKSKIGNGFLNIAKYLKKVAISIDQLGNTIGADLFNLIFINKGGYKFGNPDETISGVLGKNERSKKLSLLGRGLIWILNKLDKNHGLLSIEDDETN